jgi:multicomponent Na+:H+ antiporter subunit E
MSRVAWPRRIWLIAVLFIVLLRELWLSSVAVARAVLSPQATQYSAIVAVPLKLRTDLGITTLANCITLTPGTTSLHVSEDRSTIYVHALDATSAEDVVESIAAAFQNRIVEIEG